MLCEWCQEEKAVDLVYNDARTCRLCCVLQCRLDGGWEFAEVAKTEVRKMADKKMWARTLLSARRGVSCPSEVPDWFLHMD